MIKEENFAVYSGSTVTGSYTTLSEAISSAELLQLASVRESETDTLLWDNYETFLVYQNEILVADFMEYPEAVQYARNNQGTSVSLSSSEKIIWNADKLPNQVSPIDAVLIKQMPELPRGCEVTSLAMLLSHAGIEADKMTLAQQIRKDPTVYKRVNGVTTFGNPYDGFVGDMYSYDRPGYGVYHGPVRELAENYLPERIIDMTGSNFEDMLYALVLGKPVWVIANTYFTSLPDTMFEQWETPSGSLKITYKEHSVLLTGYDEEYIYFNDPLAEVKDRKVKIASFREAWEQMGRQAITYS
ncbi:C39 family peptidase [Paenibacillus sp. IHB B 3415]|uniref:C39 family peptidase n=1 Tax=Paenibacillus sp. IHB B 3415 TaxID=867080 RepID=UPI00069BB5DE|nr:C39 family peptidase [Paenibacillus sp. IHB B 3415]